MSYSVSQILRDQYNISGRPGKKVECPFCGKKKFSIKSDDAIGKCFHPACGKHIRTQTGRAHIPGNSTATLQPTGGCTLDDYSAKKKLPVKFLQKLGTTQIKYMGKPAVRIPYYNESGEETAVRFRTGLTRSADDDNRFRWKKGSKLSLYGLWKMADAKRTGYIVLCEGESDTQTLWLHNIPAIGLPGANTWQEPWGKYFDGIEKIYVIIEPDSGGDAVVEWITKSSIRNHIWLIQFENAKDVSELHMANPENFANAWEAAIKIAAPWSEIEQREREEKIQALWHQCRHLAEADSILGLLTDVLSKIGMVGESRHAKLLYLAVTSRFLQRPVSVSVKGPSSGGKSYLVDRVLKLFPDSAFYALSGMSERALAYSTEPLEHRFLVIYEAAGMKGEFATYLIRSLLSEGRVRYETVEKTSKGLRARMIVREGPTGLIVTTTAVRLHPENETRFLTVNVTDTPDHTREILFALAEERKESYDLTPWVAFQEWLELAEHKVKIPYARDLAALIPPVALRLRRDFSLLLNLIKSHALLHQVNRERNEDGDIIATFQDYTSVRELIVNILAEGIEVSVSATVRETVEAVQELIEHKEDSVTIKALSQKLSLDKSTTLRRTHVAIEHGYLKNLESRKGRAAQLVIGDPLPEKSSLLPTVEQLKGCRVANETGRYKPPPAKITRVGSKKTNHQVEITTLPDKYETWPDKWREAYNERAAILEFDGGYERMKAEKLAKEFVRNSYCRVSDAE